MTDLFGASSASKPKKAKPEPTKKYSVSGLGGYSTSPDLGAKRNEPCHHCYGEDFWSLRGGVGYAVCVRCHPPMVDESRVERIRCERA